MFVDIPRLMVDPYARDGDILKLENSKYRIDYNETEKQREIYSVVSPFFDLLNFLVCSLHIL